LFHSAEPLTDAPAGPPVINLIDEEGKEGSPVPTTKEDSEDAGLFTFSNFKKALGIEDDGEVAVWRKQGYSKRIII
jgi:hypothetical protein